MSSSYTGTPANVTPDSSVAITVPGDGDAGNAAAQNTPDKAMADWLEMFRTARSSIYGDGSDGALNFNGGAVTGFSGTGPYTATRDIFASSVTIGASKVVNMAGYRLYCSGLLDMSAANCRLAVDGLDSTLATAAISPPGLLLAAGGGSGLNGVAGSAAGTNQTMTNRLGGAGGVGGVSGTGQNAGTVSGETAPNATAGSIRVPASLQTGMLYGTGGVIVPNGGGGGSPGGAGAASTSGAGGGAGGFLLVCAHTIKTSATARFGAKGGVGGNAQGTNAGGGGGGGGGVVVVLYRALASGSSAVTSEVTGGAGGTGIGSGAAGSTGSSGLAIVAVA